VLFTRFHYFNTSERRIPAETLIESPWFQKWGIHNVETAAAAMLDFLRTQA